MATTPSNRWMIYGANGFTGQLIAREAVSRRWQPLLAGRSREPVRKLAAELGCEFRIFAVDERSEVEKALGDCDLLLNCAGPFAATAPALMRACLATRTHYLDITGEIDCIEQAAGLNEQARDLGILLLPAVGFDVVPTDCLAGMLSQQLPSADHLQLAFQAEGRPSLGTARTMLRKLPEGGRARVGGRIEHVPPLWKVQTIPFHTGPALAMTIPWGDVATAYYSTGIPNIEVFMTISRRRITLLRIFGRIVPLLKQPMVQQVLQYWLRKRFSGGPSAAQRQRSRVSIWGRATDAQGQQVEATMETPGGYDVTVLTALGAVQRVLSATGLCGFSTPSKAFGVNFVEVIPTLRCDFRSPE